MKKQVFLIEILILLLIMFTACSTGACFENTDPEVVVGIYSKDTGVTLKCDSVKVIAFSEKKDTLLLKKTSVTYFSFSLDPVHTSASLSIKVNKTTDTVTLTYTNYPHVISPDCGYTVYNDITSVTSTHNIIDTITIVNKSVTLNGQRNLCLFY